MNVYSEIRKKLYVSPFVSFEEIEQEQELLAGTGTDAGAPNQDPAAGENTGNDPDFEDGGAKATNGAFEGGAEYDFVFEYDE